MANRNYFKEPNISHLYICFQSLLNRQGLYAASLLPSFVVLGATTVLAFVVSGGRLSGLKTCLTSFPIRYDPYSTFFYVGFICAFTVQYKANRPFTWWPCETMLFWQAIGTYSLRSNSVRSRVIVTDFLKISFTKDVLLIRSSPADVVQVPAENRL